MNSRSYPRPIARLSPGRSLGVLLTLLPTLCGFSSCSRNPFREAKSVRSNATVRASRETLTIEVNTHGVVQADRKVTVLNPLKHWATIVAVKDEGAIVRPGDLIVEYECKELKNQIENRELQLDSAKLRLEQAIKQRAIQEKLSEVTLLQARNAVLTAEENLALNEKTSKSQLALAEEKVARAKEALQRYVEKGGERENLFKDAETAIRTNRRKLEIEKEQLAFKTKVNEDPSLQSPYSATDLDAHAVRVARLEDQLEKSTRGRDLLAQYDGPNTKRQREEAVTQAQVELELLVEFTIPQKHRELTGTAAEAQLDLDKAKDQQKATRELKDFEVKGKEKIVRKMEKILGELLEEKEKMKVRATSEGIVLYRPGWRPGGTRPIEPTPGELLYPKAKLIEIPDMTTLLLKTELLDSLNIHLRRGGKDGGGTKATFTLDTLPGREFRGHVLRANPNEKALDKLAGRDTGDGETSVGRTGDERADPRDAGPVNDPASASEGFLFEGSVLKTSPLPKDTGTHFMKSGVSAYDVFIEVDWKAEGLEPGVDLKPAMSGQVTLSLVHIENALTLPVVSIYSRDDSYFCRRLVDGEPLEQEIEIGLQNESRVQVLSGLEEDDEVLLVGDKGHTDTDQGH